MDKFLELKKEELKKIGEELKLYKLLSNRKDYIIKFNIFNEDRVGNDVNIFNKKDMFVNPKGILQDFGSSIPYVNFESYEGESKDIYDKYLEYSESFRPLCYMDKGELNYFLVSKPVVETKEGYEVDDIIRINELLYYLTRYERNTASEMQVKKLNKMIKKNNLSI